MEYGYFDRKKEEGRRRRQRQEVKNHGGFHFAKYLMNRSIRRQNLINASDSIGKGGIHRYLSCCGISLKHNVRILSPHQGGRKGGGISSLDVCNLSRFVLAGSSDGSITIYDLLAGSQKLLQMGTHPSKFPPIARTSTTSNAGRIQSAYWYQTDDTGAFVSLPRAGNICLWDTNQMDTVLQMPIPPQHTLIHSSYQQSSFTQHQLLALVFNNVQHSSSTVQLWDITQGTSTHTLPTTSTRQYRNPNTTRVMWHPTIHHYLFTGDISGNIILWDVRKVHSFVSNLTKSNHSNDDRYSYLPIGPISHLTFSQDGYYFISATNIGNNSTQMQCWNYHPYQINDNNNNNMYVPSSDNYFLGTKKIHTMTILENDTLWISQYDELHGYPLNHNNYNNNKSTRMNGLPHNIQTGHLDTITTIKSTQQQTYQILSGSKDGMILSWGYQSKNYNPIRNNDYSTQYNKIASNVDCWNNLDTPLS